MQLEGSNRQKSFTHAVDKFSKQIWVFLFNLRPKPTVPLNLSSREGEIPRASPRSVTATYAASFVRSKCNACALRLLEGICSEIRPVLQGLPCEAWFILATKVRASRNFDTRQICKHSTQCKVRRERFVTSHSPCIAIQSTLPIGSVARRLQCSFLMPANPLTF